MCQVRDEPPIVQMLTILLKLFYPSRQTFDND